MNRWLAILPCMLAIAAGAGALDASAAPSGKRKAPTAAASAEASRLLETENARDVFEDVSEGNLTVLRHRQSGLHCAFEPGANGNDVEVYPSPLPRGDDVGCSRRLMGFTQTIYASRYPEQPALEDLFAAVVASLRLTVEAAEPYRGPGVTAQFKAGSSAARAPPARSAYFTGKIDGREVFTLVSVSNAGPWTVKVRMTGSPDDDIAMQLWSQIALPSAALQVMGETETSSR